MNWNDITLKTFKKIASVLETQSEDELLKNTLLVNAIFNIDSEKLTISEFTEKLKEIKFLINPVPKVLPKQKYTINGVQYDVTLNLSKVSVTQYMDYQELVKTQDYAKILTVFMIPEGHNYNDGYDIKKVCEDIGDMKVEDVLAIYNFFMISFLHCTEHLKDYFDQMMKKTDQKVQKHLQVYMDYLTSFRRSLNGLI